MSTKINYQLFLIFIIISLTFQKVLIPKKDSFIPINTNTFNLMELKESQRELYYSYDNKFDGSDIVITLKKAKQYTTRLYFYDSYESIKTNSDGEYINFIEELDLSEKLLYIKSCQKRTYYIIIKDIGNYSTKDYFSIYNEQDIIELKQDEPFTINLFLSKNMYTFSFNAEKDEVISLDMNINNKDFSETIAISLNDEVIYQGERNTGLIKLNEDKTLEGNYKVHLSSTNDEVYTEIKSSIVLYKEKNECLELIPEKEIKLFYINSKTFSFYVDLNDYELHEENIITFKYSYNAYKNKLIDYCYAKNMNFKEFDDNKFISNMPTHEEESEGIFSKHNTLDNVYHLYFSRTQENEEDKNSYLLVHCSVKIDDELYFEPEKISAYLSPRATNLDLSEEKYFTNGNIKINEKINIEDYIPKVLKVNISVSENSDDNKLSYVFYTNTQAQTIYDKSMINADHNNEELKQIYAISNKDLQKLKENKIFYIKLFGAKQEILLKIETTKSELQYYSGDSRPAKIFTQQHLNCANSFYYIGSYSMNADDSYFYLEEIYGKYNIYYKNSLSSDDDIILTNGNSKYLINSKFGSLSKAFDIVELKCEYPGYFNLHLLNNYYSSSLTMNERQMNLVSKGNYYIYPKGYDGKTKINLEIYTPLGKEIEININGTMATINSNNRYFQMKYKKAENVPNLIILNVKEDNTVLSMKLTYNNLFKVVESEFSRVNEERILFKLPNNQDYKSVNITLKRVSGDYTYSIFKGDVTFAADPIISGYETIPLGDQNYINLILSNPYIKSYYMKSDKEDSPFYIMFYVYDEEGVQKDVYMSYNPVEQYETFPNSVIKILPVEEKKFSLNFNKDVSKVSLIYQSCGNSLKGIKIYSYDDLLNEFEVKNRYNLAVFNNYLMPHQFIPIFEKDEEEEEENKYNGAIIGFGLNEISQSEFDKFNNNNNYNVTQNGKQLRWPSLDGVKEYIIYVFHTENKNLKYLHNPCFLEELKKNNSFKQGENETNYMACYSSGTQAFYKLKEEGIFITTVMANLEGKMPMKFIYNELRYNSSEEPHADGDDEDDDNTLVIVLLVLIPIIFIIVVAIIIILIKRRKQKEIKPDIDEQQLIRNTTNSNSISNY